MRRLIERALVGSAILSSLFVIRIAAYVVLGIPWVIRNRWYILTDTIAAKRKSTGTISG